MKLCLCYQLWVSLILWFYKIPHFVCIPVVILGSFEKCIFDIRMKTYNNLLHASYKVFVDFIIR